MIRSKTYLRYEDVGVGAEAVCDDPDGEAFPPGKKAVTNQQPVVRGRFVLQVIPRQNFLLRKIDIGGGCLGTRCGAQES